MGFDTKVDDMVVLVTDEKHSRYGQIGKMLYHDWKHDGGIGVKFADGTHEEFYDGIMEGDLLPKIKRFYRHMDDKGREFDSQNVGPVSFHRDFVEQEGDLERLAEQYRELFNEDLPQIPTNSE